MTVRRTDASEADLIITELHTGRYEQGLLHLSDCLSKEAREALMSLGIDSASDLDLVAEARTRAQQATEYEVKRHLNDLVYVIEVSDAIRQELNLASHCNASLVGLGAMGIGMAAISAGLDRYGALERVTATHNIQAAQARKARAAKAHKNSIAQTELQTAILEILDTSKSLQLIKSRKFADSIAKDVHEKLGRSKGPSPTTIQRAIIAISESRENSRQS
jgi:hypothetical protein